MLTPKPTLAFQCPENWDKMKLGIISRFCENCKRDVQDFTRLSRQEILEYLWVNRNTKVCGRMYKSQLDYHHEEILVTINAYLHKNKNSNLSFYLLALGSLMLSGCTENLEPKNNKLDTLMLATNQDDVKFDPIDSAVYSGEVDSDAIGLELVTLGFVTTQDPTSDNVLEFGPAVCRTFAEVMPEYVGGYDSLVSFLHRNVRYPSWEKRKRIEGTVYVQFIVDETGKVKEPTILKTVEDSRHFNNEVIRVVNSMPNWIPGREQGENVAVMFTIPVRFRL